MIFIDRRIIRKMDPDAQTICEVGEVNKSRIVSCFVHEGRLIYHHEQEVWEEASPIEVAVSPSLSSS